MTTVYKPNKGQKTTKFETTILEKTCTKTYGYTFSKRSYIWLLTLIT